jgi:hypothetical protein
MSRRRRRNANPRRTRKFAVDPSCWGKNKPLEQLWRDLSSFLSAVIVYKGSRPYEIIQLRSNDDTAFNVSNIYSRLSTFDMDNHVVAILSAHPEIKNAYENVVYPKAKDKTVDYVITNHTKFFKSVPAHMQLTDQPIKKLRVPH